MADRSGKVSEFEIDQLEKSNRKLKACIIGSGNWGSTIARIIGDNVQKFSYFDHEVKMYVYEEMIGNEKLTDIINTKHENVKYLPGFKIPKNVVAVPDVLETAKDADILVFVIPHQFVVRTCETLKNKLKSGACGISLIKGFDLVPGAGQVKLISSLIEEMLGMSVSVLMGANLANEVAAEKFCETTIGCKDPNMGKLLKNLIETPNFRVVVTDDVSTVEVCGALKNIVACGAGFIDGLQNGDNTKAAIIRLGLMEMIKFCEEFYPGSKLDTFFQSCGVADLVTTCYGGRNRKVSEAFVLTGKSIPELEKEMLNGQKLQGPETAAEVYAMLHKNNLDGKFPLFTAIHKICIQEIQPTEIIECIRNHPVHLMD